MPQAFRRVLVVDDELNIISAVRRELNTPPLGRFRYEVEGFSDPAQALERARQQRFDAVICDYRMPAMDGLEFLREFAVLQPDCARLVLSGQTDMAALVKMVNDTHIYRFIPKPWHDYFLKSSLAQAVEFAGVLGESRRLAELVRQKGIAVPPLAPEGAEEILVVDADPAMAEALTRSLTTHTEVDDLFASIRAEISQRSGEKLDAGKLRVTVAGTAREALQLAATKAFACVLADFHLPDMSGVQLLQAFGDKQAGCERILIAGHLAQADLIDAVDFAHIFGFVGKPWQDYELKACVAQALSRRRMALENALLAEMVKKAGAVPS